MTKEELTRLILTHQAPEGTRQDPDSVRAIWEKRTAAGIGKPADLEAILAHDAEPHALKILADIIACVGTLATPFPLGKIMGGVVPTGRFDVFVMPLSSGGNAVIFDTFTAGYLVFSSFASVACAFNRPTKEQVDRFCGGMFRELDHFFLYGDRDLQTPLFAEMVERSTAAANIAGYVNLALHTFLLAHEVAHVVLGHTRFRQRLSVRCGNKQTPLDVLKTSHAEELDADAGALRIYRALASDTERWPTVKLENLYDAAPFFLFDLMEVLHARYEFLHGRPLRDPDHPHPRERKAQLLAAAPDFLHERARSLYDGLAEFTEHLLENCAAFPPSEQRLPPPDEFPV